jgi:hypothetical protein
MNEPRNCEGKQPNLSRIDEVTNATVEFLVSESAKVRQEFLLEVFKRVSKILHQRLIEADAIAQTNRDEVNDFIATVNNLSTRVEPSEEYIDKPNDCCNA